MSKRGENIYKRKDGRWEGRYIRFYDGAGKAKYGYVYARTYNDVKRKLLEKQCLFPNQNNEQVTRGLIYEDVLSLWLQSSRINVKESTYARYNHLIESHIRPALGKFQLSKMSTQLIEGYVQHLLDCGRIDGKGALSPKTVADVLTIIKGTMEYARFNNMNLICNLSKIGIKKRDKEIRVLSLSEQESLVNTLMNEVDTCKFGVLLSLYTGIRIGELCALRWENLSMDTGTLKVRETLQRIQETNAAAKSKTKVIITEPKSQSSIRDIPLPECILEVAKHFACSSNAFVLTGDNIRYMEPRTMQNRFKSYIEKSGIYNANFHALRHTFATRCVELGFEIKSLSEILGHANVNITLNRYVHSSYELKQDNMKKLTFPA